MHRQIGAFVASAADSFGLAGPVYQFGHGPTSSWPMETFSRNCFAADGFVGCELVGEATIGRLPFPTGVARTVICPVTIDGAFHQGVAAVELQRILAPGGAMLVHGPLEVTAASGHWRATPSSVDRLLKGMTPTVVGWQDSFSTGCGVFGIGFKQPAGKIAMDGVNRFLDDFPKRLASAVRVGWRRRLRQIVGCLTRGRLCRRSGDAGHVQFAVHLSVDRSHAGAPLSNIFSSQQTGSRLDLAD